MKDNLINFLFEIVLCILVAGAGIMISSIEIWNIKFYPTPKINENKILSDLQEQSTSWIITFCIISVEHYRFYPTPTLRK